MTEEEEKFEINRTKREARWWGWISLIGLTCLIIWLIVFKFLNPDLEVFVIVPGGLCLFGLQMHKDTIEDLENKMSIEDFDAKYYQ